MKFSAPELDGYFTLIFEQG